MSACCQTHDGPHVHRCHRARSGDGREHDGICLLDLDGGDES